MEEEAEAAVQDTWDRRQTGDGVHDVVIVCQIPTPLSGEPRLRAQALAYLIVRQSPP